MKKIGLITLGIFLSFTFACNSDNEKDSKNTDKDSLAVPAVEQTSEIQKDSTETKATENTVLGTEYTAKYICPNHCKGSGSDKPGDCKVCGMELMENPNYQEN